MATGRLIVALAFTFAASPAAPDPVAVSAVAPLVYQLDQSPSLRGYRYTFFGNAFFINEQGYLLTAAHVLETFRDGGQPYILVSHPDSPPRLIRVSVIATDAAHDVAILRATPNPFTAHDAVSFLALSATSAVTGQPVLALSLHPPKLQNANAFQIPVEDSSPGQVLSHESTQLADSAPPADVFLLSHPVTLGQSGSPVLALDAQSHPTSVIGLIEGRWLRGTAELTRTHPTSAATDAVPGAAVPVAPAIRLLDQHHIPWHPR